METISFFGTVISMALSVAAYFARALRTDFRKMEADVAEVKTNVALIQSEFANGMAGLHERVGTLERKRRRGSD